MTDTVSEPQGTGRRGRPANNRATPLTLDEICDTALALVNEAGLETLSLRRLAARLGVTPNAIYKYVDNRPALVDLLVSRVWHLVVDGLDDAPTDLTEWLVQFGLRTREVWLANIELASMAVAVSPATREFLTTNAIIRGTLMAAGFPDPPQAFWAFQTFTLGSVVVAATRRTSSRYFGRDPDEVLAAAGALLAKSSRADADAELTFIETRFDIGDDRHFEPVLRLIVKALLAQ